MSRRSRSGERRGLTRSVVERTRNNILGGAFDRGVCVVWRCGGGRSDSASRVSGLGELTI